MTASAEGAVAIVPGASSIVKATAVPVVRQETAQTQPGTVREKALFADRREEAASRADAGASPRPKPIAAETAFQLDSLPVLEADEASLGLDQPAPDIVPTHPVRAAAKPAPRKAQVARGESGPSALRPAQSKPAPILSAGQ